MAEDCLLPQLAERLLWRNLTLRIDISTAATDPKLPLMVIFLSANFDSKPLFNGGFRPSALVVIAKKWGCN